jgi:hypothetical protein
VRKHYGRNFPTVAGRAIVAIPLALNDEHGAWKVTAREVISGKTATATFGL